MVQQPRHSRWGRRAATAQRCCAGRRGVLRLSGLCGRCRCCATGTGQRVRPPVQQSATAHRHLISATTDQDWPAYLYSARHTSVTTGPATITRSNAGTLKAAWTFQEQPRYRRDEMGHGTGLWRPRHPRTRCGHERACGGHLGPMPQRVTCCVSAQRWDRSHPGHLAAERQRVRPACFGLPVSPRRGRVRAGRCLQPGSGSGPHSLHRLVQRTASPDAATADSSSVIVSGCAFHA